MNKTHYHKSERSCEQQVVSHFVFISVAHVLVLKGLIVGFMTGDPTSTFTANECARVFNESVWQDSIRSNVKDRTTTSTTTMPPNHFPTLHWWFHPWKSRCSSPKVFKYHWWEAILLRDTIKMPYITWSVKPYICLWHHSSYLYLRGECDMTMDSTSLYMHIFDMHVYITHTISFYCMHVHIVGLIKQCQNA